MKPGPHRRLAKYEDIMAISSSDACFARSFVHMCILEAARLQAFEALDLGCRKNIPNSPGLQSRFKKEGEKLSFFGLFKN